MRIALIRQYFDRSHGGAEAYAVRLARGLLQRGHEITVICARASADDADGMEIVKVSKGKWAGPWRHAAFAKSAGKAASRVNADVTIALARAYPCDLFRLGDPPHHIWMKLKYGPKEAKRLTKQPRHAALLKTEATLLAPTGAKLLIANSEMIKRQMVHTMGVSPDRINVLRNPVNRERFNTDLGDEGALLRAELGIREDEMVVLFSGMDFERKGLNQAAKAFAKLCEGSTEVASNMRFLVVGKGDAGSAKSILAKAGCADRMIGKGPVSDIQRYYAAANVFVLPTLYDPAANAVGEALACGTPVITTRANGASELIRPGDNGMVIGNREDSETLARAISRILATERIQRSRQFVAMVRPAPTMDEHLDAWQAILEQTLREKVQGTLRPQDTYKAEVASQIIAGRTVMRNESTLAEGILKRVELTIPVGCFEPRRERVIKAHRGSTVARYPVRGVRKQREKLFAPDYPSNVYVKVKAEDPEVGVHEFEMCIACERAGVGVMTPLAGGSDGRRSFFIGAEAPGELLLDFLESRCGDDEPSRVLLRRRLVDAIATTVGRMHAAGLNHRDLYAPHFFVCLEATGEFRITLIDLQRAQEREEVPLRWLVKDLGSLHFSVPLSLIPSTDRVRFLRRYLRELGRPMDRRELIDAIAERVKFIESRHQKVLDRRAVSDADLARGISEEKVKGQGGLVATRLSDIDIKA